ncbi:MAG: ribosome silencing factor, partial [Gammaproteobacteria bacterium]
MQTDELLNIVLDTLEDKKGQYIKTINVKDKTSVTDYMVITTGTSERHLKSLCDYVIEKVKSRGFEPLGVEGGQGSDWILVD